MLVTQLEPGITAEIVGKENTGRYWIIKYASGDLQSCWLDGQYTVVDGDTASLESIAPPPTPRPPAPPKNFGVEKTCTYDYHNMHDRRWDVSILLSWDVEPDATGYRLYKNGALLTSLEADTFTYQDHESLRTLTFSKVILYEIEAFSYSGAAARGRLSIWAVCP
jgi:hypothetical protein